MTKYFGTDGIRGSYGSQNMNDLLAKKVGWAVGEFLNSKGHLQPLVLIGMDTRPSGPALKNSLIKGLQSSGANVFDCGILPTPALSFGILDQKADFGIMITASHNAHTDNGIKCFSERGTKLSQADENMLEALISKHVELHHAVRPIEKVDLLEKYSQHIVGFFPKNFLSGLRIALDLANGATCQTTPTVLKKFGATLFSIHQGEGVINQDCGSEHLDDLVKLVEEKKADLGIAHDGDGDRVRFVDHQGTIVDGDQILGLLAKQASHLELLENSSFVATIHSNSGLADCLKQDAICFHASDVGDRNVRELMAKVGTNWGGESSGHIICANYLPTGDGLFAALSVLLSIHQQSSTLAQLAQEIKLWPSQSGSFWVSSKPRIQDVPPLWDLLEKEKGKLKENGRILLRYSGTESKIRLLVEGRTGHMVASCFESLSQMIQKSL